MLSQKSIRTKFALQLVLASATLIVIFSAALYYYIKASMFESAIKSLTQEAKLLKTSQSIRDLKRKNIILYNTKLLGRNTKVNLIFDKDIKKKEFIKTIYKGEKSYLVLCTPYKNLDNYFITLTKEITDIKKTLDQILFDIIVINLSAVFLILFYALFLSRMLLVPIKTLNKKLSNMDENFIEPLKSKDLPVEFEVLSKSINRLIARIQTFTKYQKELFIGIAHELKTPLAVMKAKNEVTLLKPREQQRYIDDLKNNIKTINEMNSMISSVLEIGRQEGDQFEKPVEIDLIQFLKEKTNNFNILAKQENKEVISNFSPAKYILKTQPTLLLHIIQNFVQNAIKFSPDYGIIEIKCFVDKNGFFIQVLDNGQGIDEAKDYFAPFKRFGNKSGVGLGLFLAKGAADAMGAKIYIQNRSDTNGAIATLFMPFKTIQKK